MEKTQFKLVRTFDFLERDMIYLFSLKPQLGMLLLLAVPAYGRQSGIAVAPQAKSIVEQKQDTIPPSQNLLLLLMRSPHSLDPLRQSIKAGDPIVLDSLLDLYPHLRRVVLHELMTTPPPLGWLAVAQDSLSRQLFRYSQVSEFDQMSLAAKRQNELFGNRLEMRNRFYQTDIIKLLRWLNTLLR